MKRRKWTPVSEGLPTEDGAYFITIENYAGERSVRVGLFEKGEFIGWLHWHQDAIAWMPANLPEPYED